MEKKKKEKTGANHRKKKQKTKFNLMLKWTVTWKNFLSNIQTFKMKQTTRKTRIEIENEWKNVILTKKNERNENVWFE